MTLARFDVIDVFGAVKRVFDVSCGGIGPVTLDNFDDLDFGRKGQIPAR